MKQITLLLIAFLITAIIAGMVMIISWAKSLDVRVVDLYGEGAVQDNIISKFVLSYQLVNEESDLLIPISSLHEPIQFDIQSGEPAYKISERLTSEGLIPSAEAFNHYLIYKGYDRQIQPGIFLLSRSFNAVDIASIIQNPFLSEVQFHIFPGWRLEEIAEALPYTGLVSDPASFLESAIDPGVPSLLGLDIPDGGTLEGFLLPGRYIISRDASIGNLLSIFTNEFKSRVHPEMLQAFEQNGLSQYQAVILASIIERESLLEDEQPLIASVFYNRLKIGMKLDSDATVQYALGYQPDENNWWKLPLTLQDFSINSPFNTYIYTGLPPAPISNPGLSALSAVAYPESSSYFYFRLACDQSGRHDFSMTLEEHISKACD